MSRLLIRYEWIILALIALSSFWLWYALFQTFGPVNPPFTVTGGWTEAKRNEFGVIITYSRSFTVTQNGPAAIYRTARHLATGATYDIPAPVRIYKKGDYKTVRSFILPPDAPDGEWRHETIVSWRPPFAFSDRSQDAAAFHFTLCGAQIPCKDPEPTPLTLPAPHPDYLSDGGTESEENP